MHDDYAAPRWLPGGNLQTIWPALYARRTDGTPPTFRRERWTTPDGDFIDVDFADAGSSFEVEDVRSPSRLPNGDRGNAQAEDRDELRSRSRAGSTQPLLVLFHGLEGSSGSHYAEAFAAFAIARGWSFAVPHFRGCSGELNLAPRAYHSGDYEEIGWILDRMKARHAGPLLVAGVSLGGNALLRWAEEAGDDALRTVRAVASISAPLDLAAGGHAIGRGFNRLVYTRMFLSTMKPKALAKLVQHPGLFDRDTLMAARDLYAFDDVFTAPLHGFRNTDDYWSRGSAKPTLVTIRVPTLVVNALNDPFVPAASLPRQADVGDRVTLWQPAHGGHVGFPQGRLPGHVRAMPDAVGAWLAARL